MNIKLLLLIATLGIIAGLASVAYYNGETKPESPLTVSFNPYEKGIYANGIVESLQQSGENTNIYPQVSATITGVFVHDGQMVKKGDVLLTMDDRVQKELVAKDYALKRSQQATLFNLQQQLDKTRKAYLLDSKSVSKNTLDSAINAVKIQSESLTASEKQHGSDSALLTKYTLTSPVDGIVLRMGVSVGDYASPLGHYDPYTQAMSPVVEMSTEKLQVRCFLDEILVPTLPHSSKFEATMFVRGVSNQGIALNFERIQPYLIPNIELSNARNERVDVRVLPIIFNFEKPTHINIFPGQLVDIYIKGKK